MMNPFSAELVVKPLRQIQWVAIEVDDYMVLWERRYGYLIEAGKSRYLDAGPPSSRAGEYAGRN